MQFLKMAYFQEKFVPFSEAKLSVATHALHYGTGAFGGMRGLPDPKDPSTILMFRLDRHAKRLSNSAKFLHYDLPAEKIMSILVEFVKKNQPKVPFYVRPLVYNSGLGIAPRLHDMEKDLLIYGMELGDYFSPSGISCRISSWYRQEDRSLPLRGKIAGAYITSALAKTEAVSSGFDESILVNSRGKICEATGMNIFMVREGCLVTPGSDQDILEGITRDSILTIARAEKIPVQERCVDKSELFIADEAFLSGTAARITPIRQIEFYKLPEKRPMTEMLRQKMTAITENRDPDYADWVFPISLAKES